MNTILALLVLYIGVPLNVLVVVMLWRRYRAGRHLRVLHERYVNGTAVLVLVVVFGLIFVNNDTLPPPLDTGVTKLVTRTTVLVVAFVPALYWLALNRRR